MWSYFFEGPLVSPADLWGFCNSSLRDFCVLYYFIFWVFGQVERYYPGVLGGYRERDFSLGCVGYGVLSRRFFELSRFLDNLVPAVFHEYLGLASLVYDASIIS